MQTTDGTIKMVTGRIVWTSGDLFKGKVKTEFNSNTPKTNAQGETMKEYGFGLAVPKSDIQEIWDAIHQEAYKLYPSGQLPSGFSMKFKDGDGVDHKGVSYSQREGWANHLVFSCTTTLPIKWFKWENGQNILINEGVKCGDYVNVQLQIKAHGPVGQGKPGLYLNPLAVQFLGYGKEIVNSPSGDQIFGNQAPPMPPGASAMPMAPQGDTPLMPTEGAGQVASTPTPSGQPPAPTGVPAPNYGVLPQAQQPQPNGAAPQGMPAPQGSMSPPPFNYNEKMPQ